MKKIVRTLSSRNKPRPTMATSSSTPGSETSIPEYVRKSSLTSPIPPNTVIHFPECPHTTPPTPRPANIPPVLPTEIVQSTTFPTAHPQEAHGGGQEPIIPTALLENQNTDEAGAPAQERTVYIRQYLSSPSRCLDCTLSLARQQQEYIASRHAAVSLEANLRLAELTSAVRAICQAASITPDGRRNGRLSKEDIRQIKTIDAEADVVQEGLKSEKGRMEGEIKRLWNSVREEWEGVLGRLLWEMARGRRRSGVFWYVLGSGIGTLLGEKRSRKGG